MGSFAEKAAGLFPQGYNCAQSVFCAFCGVHGMDLDTARRVSSSFGGGMGRLREVCGALSGAFMVIGMLYGGYDGHDIQAKAEHYRMVQGLAARFRETYGALTCREILHLPPGPSDPVPEPHDPARMAGRPCPGCIARAAELLEELLREQGALPQETIPPNL